MASQAHQEVGGRCSRQLPRIKYAAARGDAVHLKGLLDPRVKPEGDEEGCRAPRAGKNYKAKLYERKMVH